MPNWQLECTEKELRAIYAACQFTLWHCDEYSIPGHREIHDLEATIWKIEDDIAKGAGYE